MMIQEQTILLVEDNAAAAERSRGCPILSRPLRKGGIPQQIARLARFLISISAKMLDLKLPCPPPNLAS
jgi:hypothetical protein